VTLSMTAGEISGLAGVNGSGKSTLFRIAAGLVRPDAGSVEILNEDASVEALNQRPAYERVRKGLHYIPQDRPVLHGVSTLENLRAGFQDCSDNEVIFDALGRLHLTGLLDKRPSQMDGPARMFLLLARSYLANPHFLIVDEPFAGLGYAQVAQCVRMLQDLRTRGTGILLTDHNPGMLLDIAQTIHIMQEGTIVYTDRSEAARSSDVARKLYFRRV
jgi:lipopolysaccharide export system ATP-binding protein